MRTYPLGDYVAGIAPQRDLRAVATGEYRPPRAGEWYLSGALVAAYRTLGDLNHPFHIARVVKVERIVTERIVEVPTDE
jgi:hypothetical protein